MSWKRVAIQTAEVLLILTILALLAATWLPVWFGGKPGMLRW